MLFRAFSRAVGRASAARRAERALPALGFNRLTHPIKICNFSRVQRVVKGGGKGAAEGAGV